MIQSIVNFVKMLFIFHKLCCEIYAHALWFILYNYLLMKWSHYIKMSHLLWSYEKSLSRKPVKWLKNETLGYFWIFFLMRLFKLFFKKFYTEDRVAGRSFEIFLTPLYLWVIWNDMVKNVQGSAFGLIFFRFSPALLECVFYINFYI